MSEKKSEFLEVLEEMKALHEAKRSDYAGDDPFGNFLECERGGVPAQHGIYTRLTDKWTRIHNLMKKGGVGAVKNESLDDTIMDMSVYGIIWLAMRRRARMN